MSADNSVKQTGKGAHAVAQYGQGSQMQGFAIGKKARSKFLFGGVENDWGENVLPKKAQKQQKQQKQQNQSQQSRGQRLGSRNDELTNTGNDDNKNNNNEHAQLTISFDFGAVSQYAGILANGEYGMEAIGLTYTAHDCSWEDPEVVEKVEMLKIKLKRVQPKYIVLAIELYLAKIGVGCALGGGDMLEGRKDANDYVNQLLTHLGLEIVVHLN